MNTIRMYPLLILVIPFSRHKTFFNTTILLIETHHIFTLLRYNASKTYFHSIILEVEKHSLLHNICINFLFFNSFVVSMKIDNYVFILKFNGKSKEIIYSQTWYNLSEMIGN